MAAAREPAAAIAGESVPPGRPRPAVCSMAEVPAAPARDGRAARPLRPWGIERTGLRSGGAGELQLDGLGIRGFLIQPAQLQELLDGNRPSEMESLGELTAGLAKRCDLPFAFDALRDTPETQRIAHPDDGASCRALHSPLVDPIDEEAVDLHLFPRESLQIR